MNTTKNYWFDPRCAKAFWNQYELPPYQELLKDTLAWLEPESGQRWLDLGCGSGQLTRALWDKSQGQVAEILGIDAAQINENAYARLRASISPTPAADRIRFAAADFSQGFSSWTGGLFDGVVSGLSLQYAEDYDEARGCWTDAGYDRILVEVARLLKPGGTFVFSVNVPEPAWGKVAWHSLAGFWHSRNPLHFVKKAWRMWSYGGWLTRESRRGRFHYLPLEKILAKLAQAGFTDLEHRVSYVGQAFLFRCRKPIALSACA